MNCVHMNFVANVKVSRLTDQDDETKIVGYASDINIKCAECGLPFEFIGVPGGYSPHQPMVSADGLELRAPIKPSSDPVDHANVLLNSNNETRK